MVSLEGEVNTGNIHSGDLHILGVRNQDLNAELIFPLQVFSAGDSELAAGKLSLPAPDPTLLG